MAAAAQYAAAFVSPMKMHEGKTKTVVGCVTVHFVALRLQLLLKDVSRSHNGLSYTTGNIIRIWSGLEHIFRYYAALFPHGLCSAILR